MSGSSNLNLLLETLRVSDPSTALAINATGLVEYPWASGQFCHCASDTIASGHAAFGSGRIKIPLGSDKNLIFLGQQSVAPNTGFDYYADIPLALGVVIKSTMGLSNVLKPSPAAPERYSSFATVVSNVGDSSHPYAVTIRTDRRNTSEVADVAREAMARVWQVLSNLYQDLLAKCNELMVSLDIDDEESRQETATRLKDFLDPFVSVLPYIFQQLLESRKSQPELISFLLSQVLPNLDRLGEEARIRIIEDTLDGAPVGARYAAVQALDDLGIAHAKQLMASMYPKEKNRLIRNLIDASLRSG